MKRMIDHDERMTLKVMQLVAKESKEFNDHNKEHNNVQEKSGLTWWLNKIQRQARQEESKQAA